LIVLAGASRAAASDLDVTWSAANDCPDREQLRSALSRRLGREVAFGSDAQLHLSGAIEAMDGGYELQLSTRTRTGSEDRRLQARSCAELVRASLLIAELLLSAVPEPTGEAASAPAAAHSDGSTPLGWSLFARLRAVGDLGSLARARLGPGLGLGLWLEGTRFELGGVLLPSQDLNSKGLHQPVASALLVAGSASICHEFFDGPTLAPCLHFEAGRLSAAGQNLRTDQTDATVWLAVGLGARLAIRLFDPVFLGVDVLAALPIVQPHLAIEGLGVVYTVPAVLGRLELSVEARL
jgi:hypothetical protein